MSPAEQFVDGDHLRAVLKERASAGRKQPTHARLKHMLVAELFGNEREPQLDADFSDIVCKSENGIGLYAISTQDVGTYSELRTMASRLLEAEWADGQQIDDLFLVLPSEPVDRWAVDLIKRIFDVSVIWKTETGWDGASVDAALGR